MEWNLVGKFGTSPNLELEIKNEILEMNGKDPRLKSRQTL